MGKLFINNSAMEVYRIWEKIVQTAGRNALGEFAPEFAHFNDDVLFGENWNNQDIDVKQEVLSQWLL